MKWVWIAAGGTVVVVMILGALSGITREGTVRILLDDQKFWSRALWKARLHSKSLVPVVQSRGDGLAALSGTNTFALMEFLLGLGPSARKDMTTWLRARKPLRLKIMSIVLSGADAADHDLDLLNSVICQEHPDLPSGILRMVELELALRDERIRRRLDSRCLQHLADSKEFGPRVRKLAAG